MLCHTVPFALLNLGQPLPVGMEPPPFALAEPPGGGGSGGSGFSGSGTGEAGRPDSAGFIESDRYPLACHWLEPEDEARCPAILDQLEDAWQIQVEEIGFHAPAPDSDGLVDIYLTNEGTADGAYAYGPPVDSATGDGRMSTAAYIAIDRDIPDDAMPGYTVHEFNHVLQYATDFTEPTYMIWESIASAAERWTYPDMDVLSLYATDFQLAPWMGILGDGYFLWDEYEMWSYYEYGGYVWAFHMDAEWGDGLGSAGRDIWELAAQEGNDNEPDVLDAYDLLTGDWRAALLDLSAERARMGTMLAPDWAPWTGEGYRVAADKLTWADLPARITPEVGPYQTGTAYVEITDVPDGATLTWTIESEADVSWGSVAVQGLTEAKVMGTTGSYTAVDAGEVRIGAVNLAAADFDGDDRLYSAAMTLVLDGDAASGDGGAGDGGAGDGGARDGGAPGDGGADDDEGKGGCSSAGGHPALGFLLPGLALLFARRRSALGVL